MVIARAPEGFEHVDTVKGLPDAWAECHAWQAVSGRKLYVRRKAGCMLSYLDGRRRHLRQCGGRCGVKVRLPEAEAVCLACDVASAVACEACKVSEREVYCQACWNKWTTAAYHEANPGYGKDWREANRPAMRAHSAKFRAANPMYNKDWRAANPGYHGRLTEKRDKPRRSGRGRIALDTRFITAFAGSSHTAE